MKRIVFSILLLAFMAGTVMGQTHFPGWPGGPGTANAVKKIPMICPAEDDYVVAIIATANDTSASYTLPPFDEFWLLTKTIPAVAKDSVDVNVYVEGKFTDEQVIGYTTRCNGWFNIDSSSVTTGDTLGGDIKKIDVPQGVDQIRVIWDGVTGNHPDVANQHSTWIILKF